MGKEQRAKSQGQKALCSMPILAYHKVDSRRELGITSLPPRRFERQIRFLKHEGYTSISILDFRFLISDFQNRKSQIKNQKYLITFDDGYEGIYIHAYPILKKYASTAIVFVITGYIGKHNSWDASPGPRFKHLDWAQIREMADDGIWFGSHGVNHTFLTRQSDSGARYEIEASKKQLEDGLGRPVRFFSYPYGDHDGRIISFVQEAGYEAAFSLRPELFTHLWESAPALDSTHRDREIALTDNIAIGRSLPQITTNRLTGQNMYALPRIAIYLTDNMWAFRAKIGGTRGNLLPYMQKAQNRLINRCAYASMLAEWLRSRG